MSFFFKKDFKLFLERSHWRAWQENEWKFPTFRTVEVVQNNLVTMAQLQIAIFSKLATQHYPLFLVGWLSKSVLMVSDVLLVEAGCQWRYLFPFSVFLFHILPVWWTGSPIVRHTCLTIELPVHEAGSNTNWSHSVCCVQLLFLAWVWYIRSSSTVNPEYFVCFLFSYISYTAASVRK